MRGVSNHEGGAGPSLIPHSTPWRVIAFRCTFASDMDALCLKQERTMVERHVQAAVESFINDEFPAGQVVSVIFDEDRTMDDDHVLEITVTVKGTPKQVAQQEPPLLLRNLRERLRALQETAYPIVNFIPSTI